MLSGTDGFWAVSDALGTGGLFPQMNSKAHSWMDSEYMEHFPKNGFQKGSDPLLMRGSKFQTENEAKEAFERSVAQNGAASIFESDLRRASPTHTLTSYLPVPMRRKIPRFASRPRAFEACIAERLNSCATCREVHRPRLSTWSRTPWIRVVARVLQKRLRSGS